MDLIKFQAYHNIYLVTWGAGGGAGTGNGKQFHMSHYSELMKSLTPIIQAQKEFRCFGLILSHGNRQTSLLPLPLSWYFPKSSNQILEKDIKKRIKEN